LKTSEKEEECEKRGRRRRKKVSPTQIGAHEEKQVSFAYHEHVGIDLCEKWQRHFFFKWHSPSRHQKKKHHPRKPHAPTNRRREINAIPSC